MENKEDELLLRTIEDKKRQSEDHYMTTHSGFLDARQKTLVFKTFGCRLEGGYEDAERCVAVFYPDYADETEDTPLALLKVHTPKGSKKLGHRDYLGSILSLGIDRSIVGDILVREDGADIIVLKSMAEYMLSNYDKAGHVNLKCEVRPIGDLDFGEVKTQIKRDTVASLRLDNLISSAFNLSRSAAQDAVRTGLVFVDGLQITKPDAPIEEGAKLVLRGSGKAILKEIGGTTRKDRTTVIFEKYI